MKKKRAGRGGERNHDMVGALQQSNLFAMQATSTATHWAKTGRGQQDGGVSIGRDGGGVCFYEATRLQAPCRPSGGAGWRSRLSGRQGMYARSRGIPFHGGARAAGGATSTRRRHGARFANTLQAEPPVTTPADLITSLKTGWPLAHV